MDTKGFPQAVAVLDFLQSPQGNDHFLTELVRQHGRSAIGWTIAHVVNEKLPLSLHKLSERDKGTVAAALLTYQVGVSSSSAKEWAQVCDISTKDVVDLDLIDLCKHRGQRLYDTGFLQEMMGRLTKRDDFASLFNEQTRQTPWVWFLSNCQYANTSFICTLVDRRAVTPAFRDLNIGSKFDLAGMAPGSYTDIHTHIIKNVKNYDEIYSKNAKFEIIHQILNFLNHSSRPYALGASAENISTYIRRLAVVSSDPNHAERIDTRNATAPLASSIFLKVQNMKDSQADLKKLCSGLSALGSGDLKATVGSHHTLLTCFLATQVGYTPEGEKVAVRLAKEFGIHTIDYRELNGSTDRDWKCQLLATVLDENKLQSVSDHQRRAYLQALGPEL